MPTGKYRCVSYKTCDSVRNTLIVVVVDVCVHNDLDEREREREREIQRNRQRDRQTETDRQRETLLEREIVHVACFVSRTET